MHNPNCDGSHCISDSGIVRVLPLNKGDGSNLILCLGCYWHEIEWRKGENRRLSGIASYDLPEWESLKIYEGCDNA